MNHITIGVYANDTFAINVVKEEDLEKHIEYNKTMRFGRALFVDGECVNKGYLSSERISEWKEKIKGMNINSAIPSKVYR